MRADLPSAPIKSRVVPGLSLDGRRDEVVRRVLARTWDVAVVNGRAWLERAPEADPEYLHQFRVALRRCRVVERELGACLGASLRGELRSSMRWLFKASGPLRDLHALSTSRDPILIAIRESSPEAGVSRMEGRARSELVRAFRSERAERLSETLRLLPLLPDRGGGGGAFAPYLERRFERRRARVLATAGSLGAESPDEELHRLRRRVKSLRYLNDLRRANGVKGGRKAKKAASELQEALGSYQDFVVAGGLASALGLTIDHIEREREARRERALCAAHRFAALAR